MNHMLYPSFDEYLQSKIIEDEDEYDVGMEEMKREYGE